MVYEALIAGGTLLGCVGFWAAVARHRLTMEFQKQKLQHDLEVLRPPEPKIPPPPKKEPTPKQQALTALLKRRADLEGSITALRERSCTFSKYHGDKQYEQLRADSLKVLEDARKEQAQLVVELEKLLKSMNEGLDEEEEHEPLGLDAPEKPVQLVAGRPVAQRVADPGELHDAELYEQEASREGAA